MDMDFTIRPARREDCPAMLELIRELAAFERAPDAVTVTEAHFEDSGFGERPVWWGFVACAAAGAEAEQEAASVAIPEVSVQDPMLASLVQELPVVSHEGESIEIQNLSGALPVDPMIRLEEAMASSVPEDLLSALPSQQPQACGQVIGFALYYIRYSTWKGQRMYLEDLLVTEGWRRKGVGTALMDALIGAAKAGGLHGISWQVLDWNEPAIKFYERYGARFEPEWTNVAIDV